MQGQLQETENTHLAVRGVRRAAGFERATGVIERTDQDLTLRGLLSVYRKNSGTKAS